MDGLTQDLRFAFRAIRRSPVFSAIAIGCLAIGISVNVAAFSMLDALLFRDLPGVRHQRELTAVLISSETRFGRSSPSELSPPDWDAFRNRVPAFTGSGVSGTASVVLRVGGEPLAVRADFVSGGFFSMLGTQPAAGRLIAESDDRPDAPPAGVISHHLWQREFDSSADVIGKPLIISDVAFTIAGVAPKGYVGLYPGELVADPEFGAPYVILPLATASLVRAESRYRSVAAALDD